jgi:DhnA family fructose-bisphosphate aldolase class Ia
MNQVGKNKRLSKIFSHDSGKIVVVPLDDSLLSGPINGLQELNGKARKILAASPNAVIGFQGLFRSLADVIGETPSILNLTASTTRSLHTRKTLVGSLELAIMLGVEAVAVHVNISSKYESEMLRIFGEVSIECSRVGMPLMGIMYPRAEGPDGTDDNYYGLKNSDRRKYAEFVAHAARVGMELGADFIKTQYTGDPESFRTVVDACAGIPVLVAGGTRVDPLEMLTIAEGAMQAGAGGISFGRNIFSREDPTPFIEAVKKVVLEDCSAEEANAGIFSS